MPQNDIKLYKRISDNKGKNILIIGVFHGDEPQGDFFINSYLEKNEKNPIKNNVYYIPRLNFSATRKNSRGVDLNRNFPTKNWKPSNPSSDYFGGIKPNSEYETQFLVNLIEKITPDAIVTIHSPYKVVNYDGPGENLAKEVSKIVGYPAKGDIGYPTPGSFGTYCGVERKIPTLTIEIDEEENLKQLNLKFNKLFHWFENEY